MKEARRIRISALYMQEVSRMIHTELKDPRIGFVTVTSCTVASDFSVAKVKISVLGGDKELNLTMHGLNSSKKFIQSEVSRRMRLRLTPQLTFEFDPGVQKSIRVAQLLRESELGEPVGHQLPYASSIIPYSSNDLEDDDDDDDGDDDLEVDGSLDDDTDDDLDSEVEGSSDDDLDDDDK